MYGMLVHSCYVEDGQGKSSRSFDCNIFWFAQIGRTKRHCYNFENWKFQARKNWLLTKKGLYCYLWVLCLNYMHQCRCHIDRYVLGQLYLYNRVFETYDKVFTLGDPTYTKALNMAYREAYVFKFADRAGVRFACSIKLCLKEDDGCKGITVKEIFRPVIIRALI